MLFFGKNDEKGSLMKKVMGSVFVIIFIVLLIFFVAPMWVGIVNIGNCTGAAVSIAAALICLFFGKFSMICRHLWEKLPGRVILSAAGGIFCICLISAAVMSFLMLKEMNDKPKANTTLIVLGCQVRGTEPSLMLKRRLDTAYDYLSEHEEVCAVVSGGKGTDEEISEAQCMYSYLISRGVDSKRLYMEDRSTSTYENIRFSKEIIDRESLCADITIVTDGYHQYRADLLAKQQGIKAYNIPAPTSAWLLPTYWVREWFGILYYSVFG